MRVRVIAFARLRELVGAALDLDLPPGSTAESVWDKLSKAYPQISELSASTRIARNGRIVARTEFVADGDEVALLPPAGGG